MFVHALFNVKDILEAGEIKNRYGKTYSRKNQSGSFWALTFRSIASLFINLPLSALFCFAAVHEVMP
jgi:hypothetical protein